MDQDCSVVTLSVEEKENVVIKDEKVDISLNEIDIAFIRPNRFQPRTNFDDDKINELAATLAQHGMIQPIVVRELESEPEMYEIIAGERRFRAATKLGWDRVPAVVNNLDDKQTAAIGLIENLQREELSSIEEAHAYEKLLKIYMVTQESLAINLGVSQSTVANKLRLLKLPLSVQQFIVEKKITERHARALISLKNEEKQLELITEIINKGMTVAQTEDKVKKMLNAMAEDQTPKPLRKVLSRNVRIAFNTIRQSVGLIKQHGIEVASNEKEFEDRYEVTVVIPKKR